MIVRENGEETNKDSRKKGRMGVDSKEISKRNQCGKEKSSTVNVVWKNVRNVRMREKQMELEQWIKTNECDISAIN